MIGPAVHLVPGGKRAGLAVGIGIVPQRRASGIGCEVENSYQVSLQCFELSAGESGAGGERVNFCSKERFVGVDVAHAGKKMLIEQGGLDAALAAEQLVLELRGGDGEGVGAELGPVVGEQFPGGREGPDAAKSPRIAEDEPALAARPAEAPLAVHVIIPREPLSCCQIAKLAGHPEMDAQGGPVAGEDGQLFSAAGKLGDGPPGEELTACESRLGGIPGGGSADDIAAMHRDGLNG